MSSDWNRQTWPYQTAETMPKQPRPIKAPPPEESTSFFSTDFADQKHYGGGDGYSAADSDLHHGTIDPSQMPYGSGLRHVSEHNPLSIGPPQHHQHQPLQPMPHTSHQPAHTLQQHPPTQTTPQAQNAAPPAPQAPQAPAPKTPTQPNPKKRQRSTGGSKSGASAAGGSADPGPSGSPPKRSRTNTAWTQQEEQLLKQMRDQGSTWSEIAKSFPSRTEGSVKKHWYKDMHWAEFKEEESAQLLAAIKEYDANKWKFIGQKLGKPAKACEAHWKEKLGGR
ncbi:hypothetical protein TWF569_005915 [Orbilia oligospora]|uniref:Uncharacterized protein n=1 Tax=Orbilia oligospora TaxID=2813651 RepID=A0A7C8J8R0_ORBOL|nr:hypothetical protein TWF102_011336 [Orbilia oligospora]KAF3092183.1 hypothetical protein TWF103_011317 [Orbilia oligospora]KAF3116831.1 hypothetical protein TWF706_000056 [Orbilia oligospora]KAF3130436.1 hypothetical protein TWF703_008233 [Orbilia oligospora]KAF3142164.1 hypothetical protein TWF594_005529 [Orbilia oligospora]